MVLDLASTKRSKGQYYTLGNPFSLDPFIKWANKIGLPNHRILEPFAGANYIIKPLQSLDMCRYFDSFDISPADSEVNNRDTIKSFPEGYQVCVTNPPWLAKNSATRRKLPFPLTPYDDLYKHCLSLCLQHCDYVAALVPASFLHSNLFRDRLSTYILLHNESTFNDTENPVCLALFDKAASYDTSIYYDNNFIGDLRSLEKHIPTLLSGSIIKFNDPHGNLGLVTFDSSKEPTIRFCDVEELKQYPVKVSSRFFVRIGCNIGNIPSAVVTLNKRIYRFRYETSDLFLTPFKGIRRDGYYRRRMSFEIARRFISTID